MSLFHGGVILGKVNKAKKKKKTKTQRLQFSPALQVEILIVYRLVQWIQCNMEKAITYFIHVI